MNSKSEQTMMVKTETDLPNKLDTRFRKLVEALMITFIYIKVIQKAIIVFFSLF